jgi:hypothetical protein
VLIEQAYQSCCILRVCQKDRAAAGHILSDVRCLFSSNPLLHDALNLPLRELRLSPQPFVHDAKWTNIRGEAKCASPARSRTAPGLPSPRRLRRSARKPEAAQADAPANGADSATAISIKPTKGTRK